MTSHFTSTCVPPVCGFNLLEKFIWGEQTPRGQRFQEWDFDFMATHGFRFVRLPMDYRFWLRDVSKSRRDIDETALAEIAEAVEMGRGRGMHVSLNFHRGPGYCINRPEIEPYNLWTDERAQEDFAYHWKVMAEYFADVDPDALSFDLINEPPQHGELGFTPESHRKVMAMASDAIHSVTPERLIICDGRGAGHHPSPELIGLGVAQSMRGYLPVNLTHYKAPWVTWHTWPWADPAWPAFNEDGGLPWDRAMLDRVVYQPWRDLQAEGVGLHCGELGVYNLTPPDVTHRYLDDLLSLLCGNGWGWAMWNLRGTMGVLDNGRAGTRFESCDGHQLDREMLEILKRNMP